MLALVALAAAPALTVVATTQDPAALAKEIGGDRIEVTALCRGNQDPHFLDAKPSYMLAIHNADLVLSIGLDLEVGWLPPLLTGARNPKVLAGAPGSLDLSTLIRPLDAGAADRASGDVHPRGNPHYWLDPENGRLMARGIAAKLSELDPAGAATYAANLKAFEAKLDEREAAWAKQLAPLQGKPIVTFHKSWMYFAQRYGLDVVAYVEPKPGIQPTAQHTVEVIRTVEAKGARCVLMENFYDRRSPDQIASHSKAKVVFVPSSVNGDATTTTYTALLDRIVGEVAQSCGGGG